MPLVLITCQVEDAERWEREFRSHGALFRGQTITRVDIGSEDDYVGAVFHCDDLDTYMRILESPETAEAMANDGVKRETVKILVLDRRFDP
jgi:hypothetical protein